MKKYQAKEKFFREKNTISDGFIIPSSKDYGVVIEVRYNVAHVLYDNEIVLAKLRRDINLVCNQVLFPGDKVILEKNNTGFVIRNLVKRTSILSRVKKDRTRLDDIGTVKKIAANVDVAVIVVAAKEPPLHPKFIDRYLLVLQNNNIPIVICLNKCDLKTDVEEQTLNIYIELGFLVIETSTYTNDGIEELMSYLKDKQAILVGNSGVGKSSLINSIMNINEIKTSHIGVKSKRGRHTTTTSKYYIWDDNSSIIDTPGIRSLDVSSFEPITIQDYFPELIKWKEECKYSDCLHYSEPYDLCAVKQNVVRGLINIKRYESYLKIVSDLINDNKNYERIISDLFDTKK